MQVVCDHCGRTGHPPEQCFDLHPELKSGGRDRGKGAPRGQGSRDGRVVGAGATGRSVVSATPTIEATVVAWIEHLEKRLAAMASSGVGASTSHDGRGLLKCKCSPEVGKTSSMIPTPPRDPVVRTEASTSHIVSVETSSSATMEMATSMMRSPLFSATELIATRLMWRGYFV
ncbi:hypothetical protein AXG93_3072s1020 [Marchantia polymorpha subsp. ruderalis]|uniref:Uncharacterized protein n=1 Tax=Marchantia polymorpha subsp. ruderalis TaxID=1480154 RepID=A0A176WFB7_MARPO|nr:hypothetical protein AXG93_3072s1020 [Marchantia polymorpha subsp. ruderalis]